jgi:hypothetical protein
MKANELLGDVDDQQRLEARARSERPPAATGLRDRLSARKRQGPPRMKTLCRAFGLSG